MAELFQLQIISPNRIFYDGQVTMVEMTTGEGEIGVYARHLPITTTLEPGIVKIHEEGTIKEAAVHAGFVVILQGITTPSACYLVKNKNYEKKQNACSGDGSPRFPVFRFEIFRNNLQSTCCRFFDSATSFPA